MAHTPGPWFDHIITAVAEEQDGEYGTATCITTSGEQEYCDTGWRGDLIAWVPHDRRHDDNARLIAAAPELLACLHSLRVVFASLEGWRDMDATLVDQFISSDGLHRVDAAIAKATGKESE